jgi:ABC-2 type transport system ATP-binding protein
MGKTVIISSHILLELAEMCTDIAILQGGQLVVAGDVEKVTHQLGGGRQLEVHVLAHEYIDETMAILKDSADISNVTSSDDTSIQADFAGDDVALHRVLATLVKKGLPITSFAPRSGGGLLEEVFMHITERNSQS